MVLQDLLQMNSSDPRPLLFGSCKTLGFEFSGPGDAEHLSFVFAF